MRIKFIISKKFCGVNIPFYLLLFFLLLTGCRKFIEVDAPYTSFNGNNVYTTDATAISAVTAMYTQLGGATGFSENQLNSMIVAVCTGLSADELSLAGSASANLKSYYTNSLGANSAPLFWTNIYSLVYLANAAIEGLNSSNSLTPAVKQQLLGEAKFMRAFSYFYMVNLYGDVPLGLSTDYKMNSLMARTSASTVWQQIITDLMDAKDLLKTSYVGADVVTSSTTTRLRPNKWTAAALLARAYLYTDKYVEAEAEATAIINSSSTYTLSSTNNAFLKDLSASKEAIWQIQTITADWNTNDARVFILPDTGPDGLSYPVYLNKRLVDDFEPGDNRKTNWIKGIEVGIDSFYYAYKYKSATQGEPVTEYNTVFRLAEQYLIRAEARAMQNKFQQAIDDVNIIRLQHGELSTPLSAPSTQSDAMKVVLHERRVELFCEWGHRWLDLKRTNKVDDIMSAETLLKGGTWESTDKLFPIPANDLKINPNLTQTPGYH